MKQKDKHIWIPIASICLLAGEFIRQAFKIGWLVLAVMLLSYSPAFAQTGTDLHPQVYDRLWGKIHNVMAPEYGAVGDSATDDVAAFQAASVAAVASGGVVFAPIGDYDLSSLAGTDTLVFPSLVGQGPLTRFYLDADSGVIRIDSGGFADNFAIYWGDTTGVDSANVCPKLHIGKISGQTWYNHVSRIYGECNIWMPNAHHFTVRDCDFKGKSGVNSGALGFNGGASFGVISGNKIRHSDRNAISLDNVGRNLVLSNNILDSGLHSGIAVLDAGDGEPPTGGFNMVIEGGQIGGFSVHNGIDFNPNDYSDSLGILIDGVTFYDNQSPHIYSNGGGVTITNCKFRDCGSESIRFLYWTGQGDDTAIAKNIHIRGNDFLNSDTAGTGNEHHLYLGRVSQVSVTGNSFYWDTTAAAGKNADIYVSGFDVTISGNVLMRDTITGGLAANADLVQDSAFGWVHGDSASAIKIYGNTGVQSFNDTIYNNQPFAFNDGLSFYGNRLPADSGSNAQVLHTDGAGNLSWAADDSTGGGGSGVWADTTGVLDVVWFVDSEGDTLAVFHDSTNGQAVLQAGRNQSLYGVFDSISVAGSVSGQITLSGATSGSATIKVADVAGTPSDLTLPTTDGSNGDQLTTDGSGVLSWAAAGGGGLTYFDEADSGKTSVLSPVAGNDSIELRGPVFINGVLNMGSSSIVGPAFQSVSGANAFFTATGTDSTIIGVSGAGPIVFGEAANRSITIDTDTLKGVDGNELIFGFASIAADSGSFDQHKDGTVDGADLVSTLKDSITTAHTHVTSDGSDHSFIDQDVTSGSSPTLDAANITGTVTGAVEQVRTDARKASAGTITKGSPVYITGYGTNWLLVEAADASSSGTMPAIGMALGNITNSATGIVVVMGELTGQVTDTNSANDAIYVANGGGWTTTKPTGTNLIQKMGLVLKSNVATGVIGVVGAGRTNDVPNIPSAQFWVGNGSAVATPVTMSGNASMTNAGVVTVSSATFSDSTDAITDGGVDLADLASTAVDSSKITDGDLSLDDLNWRTECIQFNQVYGHLPADSTELSLGIFEGYTPVLTRDSTWNASAKDSAYFTCMVPFDCTVDSLIITYKVTGTAVLIDSLVLRGPDRSAYTNLTDSTYYSSGTNLTSTSSVRHGIDLTNWSATHGDFYGIKLAIDLAADNGTVKIHHIQLVVKR